MNEEELWNWMRDDLNSQEFRHATAILKRDIRVLNSGIWPKGTKVKVIMASKFGDIGITKDLNTDFNYSYRSQAVSHDNYSPADLLDEITPLPLKK